MKKRIVSLTVILSMALAMIPAFSLTAHAADFPGTSGGTGDVSNPYIIANLSDLEALSDYAATNDAEGEYFELTADIDMSGAYGDGGKESWTSIGDVLLSYSFKGTFDGKGHTIKGLYIGEDGYGGLFDGIGTGGTVKNLSVSGSIDAMSTAIGGIAGTNSGTIENCYSDVDITGRGSLGGIAGLNADGTIKDCYNTGNISNSYESDGMSGTGGIAGDNSGESGGGTIQSCYNAGILMTSAGGNSPTGGIAGNNSQGKIESCYNTGEIITGSGGESFAGGIAGNNTAEIENSYNTADIRGEVAAGGIAGNNYKNSADTGSIKNSYNAGSITATDVNDAGGIAGKNTNAEIQNCYYLTDTAQKGIGSTDDVTGTVDVKTADEFKTLASSLNSGTEAWEDSSFLERPILTALPEGGDGKEATPYTIPDKATLEKIREYINTDEDGGKDEYFKLTADIALDGGDTSQWTPIGTESNKFQGTFDGDGHKISGLYIDNEDKYQGLFGCIETSGTVKNLGVEGSVTAGDNSGGIAGQNEGTIICCYNGAAVTGSDSSYCGGIAGTNKGKIENCYNAGSIDGSLYIGGIAGLNNGTIENCYNTSVITDHFSSFSFSGAIAGQNGGAATVKNCYYLEKDGLEGIGTSGSGGTVEKTESKTENEFNSGAVTWLLQKGQTSPDTQVWGQKLGVAADEYPVLTSDAGAKVLKVAFIQNEAEYDAKYTNPNGKVTLPSKPERDNYTFEKWSKTKTADGDEFDESTSVTEDMTVYAVGRDHFGGDSNEIVLSGIYGYASALTANLDDYMEYANEDVASENKFEYSIESDDNNTNANIEGNTLSVPTGLNADDYTITVTATEKTPQYSLMSVDSYGTEDVTLTVKVSIAKADSSAAVTAENLTYNGTAQNLVSGTAEGGTLKYAASEDGEYSETVPTGINAQEYEVWYKVEGDSNHNNIDPAKVEGVEIKRADSSLTTAPEAKSDLTYDGTAQKLVTAGETDDGTLQYSTTETGGYSENIPTGTDAKDYEVWYKVVGDGNHNDSTPQKVDVTIKKADSTLTVDGGEVTYGDTITLTADVTRSAANGIRLAALELDKVEFYIDETSVGSGTVTYDSPLDDRGTAKIEIKADKRFEIGENTIRAEYGGSINLNNSEKNEITVTMEQKPLNYEVSADSKVYDENTTVDVTLTPTNNGEDDVTLTAKGAVSSADVGSYSKVDLTEIALDGNDAKYYSVETEKSGADLTAEIEITKAPSNVTSAPAAKDLTYDGTAQGLVTAGETADGTMQYSLDNDTYSPDIPKGTEADTYTVWYKVAGDGNHNDSEPQSVEVTLKKAAPSATVTPKDLKYTGGAQELVTGETSDGTLQYSTDNENYSPDIPTGTTANTYTVWYKIIGDGNHNDSEPQKVDVTINKADSTLAVDGGEVTYGDTITLTATVTRDNTNGIRLATVELDKVEFFLNGTSLGTANVTYSSLFDDDGTATFEITANKRFEIGANTIRAEYGGSINLNNSEKDEITVTMEQKPLNYEVSADSKVYDKNTTVDVTLTPTNNGEDNVTLTAKGTVSSADVGSYSRVDLTDIKADGADAKYYSVETEKNEVNLTAGIEITKADGAAAVTMADYKCGDESVNPVPASDTNGTENVTYTYAAKGADEYGAEKPLLAGEYTVKAVFAATNNYKEVTVTDDFEITHNWGAWKITEEPTQTTGGTAERVCMSADNDEPDTYALPNLTDASVWTKGTYVKPTPDREGSQEYTSEYGTVTEIIPKLAVTEIRVKNNPADTTVTEGMTLDVTGLEVEAVYSDNSTADVTHDCKLSCDTSVVGTQTVTVEYGGKTAAFNITVAAKELTGITITRKPDKRLYNKGDSLDTTGMVVIASYNNGTEAQITEYTAHGYSAQTVGTQTVTVSYGGFTAEFTVTVEEVTAPSGTVPTPMIETSGFYGGKTVTLTCAAADAKVYYTTDGSAPTSTSTLYTEPIKVTETTVIKAIAVKDGMEQSRAASGKVSVPKTDAPAPGIAAGEVESGTLVTLRSASGGAEIFYTTDGTAPTTESARYDGAIAVTEEMTIKAIAVKNGYAASDVCEVSYTVKEREPNTANLSVGSAVGKAGDTVYVPVYITADGDITDYRFTLTFDSTKLAYASVSSPDGAAGNIFTSLGENSVTVLYNDSDTVESGEVCRVGFKALDGAADGEYALAVSGAEISVGNAYSGVTTANGKVTLSTPGIKVSADAVFTDKGGNEVDRDSMSGEVDASLTIDEVEGTDGEKPMIANILLAVYDRSGALAALNVMEADLSDTSFVFQKTISIPENVSVGSIKMMIWNGLSDMSPLTAASKML